MKAPTDVLSRRQNTTSLAGSAAQPGPTPISLCCPVGLRERWHQQTPCGPDPAALPAGPQHSSDRQRDKWLLSVSLPVTGEGTAKWKLPRRSLPAGSYGPDLRGASEGAVGPTRISAGRLISTRELGASWLAGQTAT